MDQNERACPSCGRPPCQQGLPCRLTCTLDASARGDLAALAEHLLLIGLGGSIFLCLVGLVHVVGFWIGRLFGGT